MGRPEQVVGALAVLEPEDVRRRTRSSGRSPRRARAAAAPGSAPPGRRSRPSPRGRCARPCAAPAAQRQPGVDAGRGAADVAGADQQPVARHLGVRRVLAQGAHEQARHPQDHAEKGTGGAVGRLRRGFARQPDFCSMCVSRGDRPHDSKGRVDAPPVPSPGRRRHRRGRGRFLTATPAIAKPAMHPDARRPPPRRRTSPARTSRARRSSTARSGSRSHAPEVRLLGKSRLVLRRRHDQQPRWPRPYLPGGRDGTKTLAGQGAPVHEHPLRRRRHPRHHAGGPHRGQHGHRLRRCYWSPEGAAGLPRLRRRARRPGPTRSSSAATKKTRLWTTSTGAVSTVSHDPATSPTWPRTWSSTFTKDPYDGGCAERPQDHAPASWLWRSCTGAGRRRSTPMPPGSPRSASSPTAPAQAGSTPARSTGKHLGRYQVRSGWFGDIEFETPTALLLEVNGARKAFTAAAPAPSASGPVTCDRPRPCGRPSVLEHHGREAGGLPEADALVGAPGRQVPLVDVERDGRRDLAPDQVAPRRPSPTPRAPRRGGPAARRRPGSARRTARRRRPRP